jgi:hypothetical protein
MPDTVNPNLISETVVDAEFVETAAAPVAAAEAAQPAASPIPAIKPKPAKKANASYRNLTTITAISFSLTFVGVSVALLTGVLPRDLAALDLGVDMGVVLLMVPVCALVLATLVEVLRTALRGLPRIRPPRPATILSPVRNVDDWRAGVREG